MAYTAITVTVGSALRSGDVPVSTGSKPDPVAKATTADTDAAAAVTAYAPVVSGGTDFTAVDDAIGVLVADGASPTQAHVNTLNSAWTTYKTDQAALKTAVDLVKTDTAAALATLGADVAVIFNSTILSRNALKAALQAALRAVEGSGTLTP